MSVSYLMMEGYFAKIRLTRSGMALLTSCSVVLAASESAAVLLQESFFTSLGGTAGAELTSVAYLGDEIGTVGGDVVAAATYNDVSGLWSLSNTCACRGGMDSWNFLRKSRPRIGVATLASENS